ncbi:MAG: hypothetical protein GY851_15720, partial [bacterium]|nr:hypothetical protein [bacterium]
FAPERRRTRSLSYSCFHLYAMFNLATMGEYVDVDLWHFSTDDGRSLHKALDFLAKHAGSYPPQSWPYQEKAGTRGDWWDPFHDQLPVVLYHAAKVYEDEQYAEAATKILETRDGLAANRLQLILGIPLIGEQAIDGWLFQPSSESPVFER